MADLETLNQVAGELMWRSERGHMLIDKGVLDPDPDLAAFAPEQKKTM